MKHSCQRYECLLPLKADAMPLGPGRLVPKADVDGIAIC